MRIVLLQQTRITDDSDETATIQKNPAAANDEKSPSVLQEVIDKATLRDAVEREIRGSFHYVPQDQRSTSTGPSYPSSSSSAPLLAAMC